jgi:hypothetical protein
MHIHRLGLKLMAEKGNRPKPVGSELANISKQAPAAVVEDDFNTQQSKRLRTKRDLQALSILSRKA